MPDDEPSLRALIQPVEVQFYAPQSELFVVHEPTTGLGLAQYGLCFIGLLPCIAGVGVAPLVEAPSIKAEDARAAPLKDAVADVPFAQRFEDAYSTGLTANGVRHEMVMSTSTTDWDKLDAFVESASGSVMFTTVWYYLTSDFSAIELRMHTEAFARADAARRNLGQKGELGDDPLRGPPLSRANSFYWTDFRYEARLPSPDKSAERNAEAWQRDGGTRVRAAVLGAIDQGTRVMSQDFGSRLWTKEPKLPKVKTREGDTARLVEEIPGQGRLLQLANGNLLFEATVPEVSTATGSVAPAAGAP